LELYQNGQKAPASFWHGMEATFSFCYIAVKENSGISRNEVNLAQTLVIKKIATARQPSQMLLTYLTGKDKICVYYNCGSQESGLVKYMVI